MEKDQTAGEFVETVGIKPGGEVMWLVMAMGLKAQVWIQN